MRYVILGGTGTLGKELIKQLLKRKETCIVCFSRDELKQKQTASQFKSDALSFKIGDIRDRDALRSVIRKDDTVFHVAAMKHVDTCEYNPEECIKTNLVGTINVADICQEKGAYSVVFSSTDKAVDPINVYGMSKGLSEKILINRNIPGGTKFSVFRWGNVIGSRGSVVEPFVESLTANKTVKITHADMTRFWIRIEDAVRFMLENYKDAPSNGVLIPPIKSAPVTDIAGSIARILNVGPYKTVITGMRPGEKIHEMLRSIVDKSPMWSGAGNRFTEKELDNLLTPLIRGVE